MMIKAFIISGFLFLLTVAFHCAAMLIPRRGHRNNGSSQVKELLFHSRLIAGIGVGAALVYAGIFFNATFLFVGPWTAWIAFLCGLFLLGVFCFVYLTMYYLFDRSVSATLLECIENSEGKGLSGEEVLRRYSVREKYASELKGMLDGGFLVQEKGAYRNSSKGVFYARIAVRVKKFFKLGPGG